MYPKALWNKNDTIIGMVKSNVVPTLFDCTIDDPSLQRLVFFLKTFSSSNFYSACENLMIVHDFPVGVTY